MSLFYVPTARRSPHALAWTAVVAACVVLAAPAHAQLAEGQDKFLGNVGKGNSSAKVDPDFSTYWNQVTPENAGKWESAEPVRDQMNWTVLDYWYGYAQDQGFPFKQHTFVWGNQEPDWIGGLSASEQRAEVEEWMRLYFQRYPETASVDVVNEPIPAPASYRGALGGAGATGWDWVVWSFEKAKLYRDQYAPGTKLLLNDYDILKNSSKRATYLGIVRLLQDRGLIDGVGVQAHFLESTSDAAVKAALDEIAATGLPIYVSELDLNFASAQAQLDKYKSLFPVLWEHPAVAGVTLWGYKEGSIWRDDAYLVRADGSERPALTWLREYLEGSPPGGRDAFARIEAESLNGQQGLTAWSSGFGYFDAGDWARYSAVDFGSGAGSVTVRLAVPANFAGKQIELRLGSPTGTLVGSLTTRGTGGWNSYAQQTTSVSGASGVRDLYLVGRGGANIANVDWLSFEPAGSGGPVAGGAPVGQTIWLRARVNGRYVAADLSRSGVPLIADRGAVGEWERFAVTDGADDDPETVAFRAQANGTFVAVDAGGPLEARGSQAGPSDRFVWEPQPDGTVCLRSQNTGGYVVAENAGASVLRADRPACRAWERFTWGAVGGASVTAGLGVADGSAVTELSLEPAYPNPTRSEATIRFGLPEAGPARVEVSDALGRRVAVLAEGAHGAGWHRATLDGRALPAGVYLVRLEAAGRVATQRLTLVR